MEPTATAAEPQSTVSHDLPCVRCGYNLRTLPEAGRCPECGTQVALTVSLGGDIARGRPGYARRLAWASATLFAARVAAFVATMLPFLDRHAGPVTYAGYIVASLLCLVGSWMLATREHPHLPLELAWTARAIRILTLLAFLLFLPFLARELLHSLEQWYSAPNWLADQHCDYAAEIATVLYLLYPALEMRIMVRLSKRLAHVGLKQRALVTGIAAASAGLALCLMLLVDIVFSRSLGPGVPQWFRYTCGALFCVVLLCWLWTAWNCLLAARIFAKASRDAAARWGTTR